MNESPLKIQARITLAQVRELAKLAEEERGVEKFILRELARLSHEIAKKQRPVEVVK